LFKTLSGEELNIFNNVVNILAAGNLAAGIEALHLLPLFAVLRLADNTIASVVAHFRLKTMRLDPEPGSRVAGFFSVKNTKTGKVNVYQITINYIYTQNGQEKCNTREIDQMAIKYNNSVHCKNLQNLPKLVFSV
jgi:hypothetical protein